MNIDIVAIVGGHFCFCLSFTGMENWNLVMSLGFRGALVVDGRSFLCFWFAGREVTSSFQFTN